MGLKKTQKLKELQTRLTKANLELSSLDRERREASQKFNKAKQLVENLNNEIEKLRNSELIVSEHAILRYLERVMSIDIEQVQDDILGNGVKEMAESLGNGKYPITTGVKAVVKNGVVVSVI